MSIIQIPVVQMLRDTLATLSWEIMETFPITKRASIRKDYYSTVFLKERRQQLTKNDKGGNHFDRQTGYPSIDRPWTKYYRSTPSKDISKYQRIYNIIFDSNKMSSEALGFLDGECTWTFKKLKEHTDKCMDAFKKNGIKKVILF